MRLAVFDTNVVVSAAIKREGAPAKLMMDWVLEGQVQLVTSPRIVAEYREVIRRDKFHRYGFPPLWLEFMIEESLQLSNPDPWPHPSPDPKDGPFLALAHASGAWLVTGNLKHFPEAASYGVNMISMEAYKVHLYKVHLTDGGTPPTR
jgi:putative PIN family toxin of toxin-antitoxin system